MEVSTSPYSHHDMSGHPYVNHDASSYSSIQLEAGDMDLALPVIIDNSHYNHQVSSRIYSAKLWNCYDINIIHRFIKID